MNRPDRTFRPPASGGPESALAASDGAGDSHAIAFGRFVLNPKRKMLLAGPCPVHLGSRAFDLLVALVSRAGQVVGHAELLAKVWPTTVVEENSLRVHLSALRRALGDTPEERYILTVPGHGYSFVMPLTPLAPAVLPVPHSRQLNLSAAARATATTARMTRIVGRDGLALQLAGQLAAHRMVSLVGPGGIGKTTAAQAFVSEYRSHYSHGAVLVELAALEDPALLPATVATALGISAPLDDATRCICSALRDAHLLLVLDNCEHLLMAAAVLAEQVLAGTARVEILTTSREPLYARGEWVNRLAPLRAPGAHDLPTLDEAMGYPAIALFVERAQANADRFTLNAENLPLVSQLCRQLDGLPLAIELAAARVDSLGVEGLAARLGDLFELLTRGRRTAVPRHAALQAVFDCSYRLLGDTERLVLQRLSVFRANFALEAAADVCACGDLRAAQVLESVLTLAAKSLLSIEMVEGFARYRLLNTTRRYALKQLECSADTRRVAERHARHMLGIAEQATADVALYPMAQWQARYGGMSADLMGALEWAFSAGGNAQLGIELAATVPFPMIELGMAAHYCKHVEQALACLGPAADASLHVFELRLLSTWALCTSQVQVRAGERAAMCARLDRLTPGDNPVEFEALALASMCMAAFGSGDYLRVEALVGRITEHARAYGARGDAVDALFAIMADRWHALAAHHLGRHVQARTLAQRVMATDLPPGSALALGPIPQAVSMGIVLARIEWLGGQSERALATAQRAVDACEGLHPFALCQALAMGLAPIAMWRGDTDLAAAAVTRLQAHANRQCLVFWTQWANSLARILRLPGLPDDIEGGASHYVTDSALANDLLVTLDAQLYTPAIEERVDAGEALWCAPEVLRLRAEQELSVAPGRNCAVAESLLWRALEMARAQGALAWELRCAMSLARLWARTGRGCQAAGLLSSVYGKYTEGFETVDMVSARAMMGRLQGV